VVIVVTVDSMLGMSIAMNMTKGDLRDGSFVISLAVAAVCRLKVATAHLQPNRDQGNKNPSCYKLQGHCEKV